MSFKINNSASISLTNSGSYLTTSIVGSSTYTITGFNCNCLRRDNIKRDYESTGEILMYKGQEKAIYRSKANRLFIFVLSKNSIEYRRYLK